MGARSSTEKVEAPEGMRDWREKRRAGSEIYEERSSMTAADISATLADISGGLELVPVRLAGAALPAGVTYIQHCEGGDAITRVRMVDAAIAGCTHACNKKILPAGAVLWAWDTDPEYDEEAGEEWLFLRPEKWNSHVQYAWRYDPCESWHHRVPCGCRHASRKLTRRTHGSRMTNATHRTILSDLAECFSMF